MEICEGSGRQEKITNKFLEPRYKIYVSRLRLQGNLLLSGKIISDKLSEFMQTFETTSHPTLIFYTCSDHQRCFRLKVPTRAGKPRLPSAFIRANSLSCPQGTIMVMKIPLAYFHKNLRVLGLSKGMSAECCYIMCVVCLLGRSFGLPGQINIRMTWNKARL